MGCPAPRRGDLFSGFGCDPEATHSAGRRQQCPRRTATRSSICAAGPRDTHLGLYAYDPRQQDRARACRPCLRARAPERPGKGPPRARPHDADPASLISSRAAMDARSSWRKPITSPRSPGPPVRRSPSPTPAGSPPAFRPTARPWPPCGDNDLHVIDLATGQRHATDHRRHGHPHARPGRIRRCRGVGSQ